MEIIQQGQKEAVPVEGGRVQSEMSQLTRPRGAPEGKWNGNYRHGAQTKATIELWRFIKSLR